MSITGPLARASIFVRDTEASLALYRDVLGMDVADTRELAGPVIGKMLGLGDCRIRVTYLSAEGSEIARIGLFEVAGGGVPDLPQPSPASIHRGQVALVMDSPHIPDIHRRLKAKGYRFVCEPATIRGSKGGLFHEFLFLDPDGVVVDLIRFEPEPGQVLTDIAARTGGDRPEGTNRVSPLLRASVMVRDMARSVAFYRDALGIPVVDTRRITGPDVGKVLGVGDCEVDVTYLSADRGGIGVLGLFQIRGGRVPELPRPATDRIHRGQLALVFNTGDMAGTHARLQAQGAAFLCPPSGFPTPRGTFTEMIAFDPDGVAVSLIAFQPNPP